MTKSELIDAISQRNPTIGIKNIENSVKEILEHMSLSMENAERIEIRGFGSFSLHFRQPRIGRNPKTGESVKLEAKCVPHFKAGKELKERVDNHA
ncbi:integration host factor subunit beta [Actinobacillus porcinus]|uniref:Integration host factor subunit beta n=1 Tax=Actinobacillus porcinus TaxID=51048 RepID=A0ABY6TJI8_9PAST|nr:integration host factor subunit beta [Actinobacillus porcinus]MCI5764098.1 integration host factor subunit beta [Actinobacillus porcinus]MDD7544618.1 integration host factor subunit beta [Actinobacillus porcinus]MDY5848655.1 integration host factor subunit beta [Actinobacillus porcinus]MDY6216727.1 integration host factor subunit beta [Actinobacillus porcinus]VFY92654.1 integration host factor subunit beta [Actinobacillus porcinus]